MKNLTANHDDLRDAMRVLGFCNSEMSILFFLLEIQEAAASTIATRIKMKRSSCYMVLDSLVKKGFVDKRMSDGVLVFSINARYSFKVERDIYSEASKKLEKAFSQSRSSFEPLDFDEVLDVAIEVLKAHLNELCGLFLIDEANQKLYLRRANLLSFGPAISALIGQSLYSLNTSLTKVSNLSAKTVKLGKPIVSDSFVDFFCPTVSKSVAIGIQSLSRTKVLYSYPISSENKTYGIGVIALKSRDNFEDKKLIFSRIMQSLADCLELKSSLHKLAKRSAEIEDLKRLRVQIKKMPEEIFKSEFMNFFTRLKMDEVKNAYRLML